MSPTFKKGEPICFGSSVRTRHAVCSIISIYLNACNLVGIYVYKEIKFKLKWH